MNRLQRVSFLGLLALVANHPALPQDPDSDARAQIAGAFSLTYIMKASIAQAYGQYEVLPSTCVEADMTGPQQTSYATATLGQEGVITVSFNDRAVPALRGKIVKFVPMLNSSDDVIFYCLAPALPQELRPSNCH